LSNSTENPLLERVMAISTALAGMTKPATAATMGKPFARAKAGEEAEILETLCAMDSARRGAATGTHLQKQRD
jgi:hypothetical protein